MNINFIEFGMQVRGIREKLGYTQSDVYNRIGVSNETQRRIEHGSQEPRISTLERLSYLYKYDLISLLVTCRFKESFLSESIIHSINQNLINCDYITLGKTIRTMIGYFINTLSKPSDEKAKEYLIRYLESFNKIEFSQYRETEKNIINVENFLLFLNNNKKGIGHDTFLYDLETSSIIYLLVLYRQANMFEKSIDLALNLITKIQNYPNLSKLQLNHLGAIYLNLAYAYHRLDQFENAINVVEEALTNRHLVYTSHLYNELLIRKAFALYYLGDRSYETILDSVLMNCTPEHKKTIQKVYRNLPKIFM